MVNPAGPTDERAGNDRVAGALSGGAGDAGRLIRVVRGTPTAEELAALVGVVISRTRAVVSEPTPLPTPMWVHSARPAGALPQPGPGAWRGSALPR